MRKFVIAASALSLLAASPAFAKEMHCNVNSNYKAALDGQEFEKDGTKYQIKVKNTYSGLPENITTKDYNGFVQIKWGTEKTGNSHTNVMVRPRKSSECLNAIFNEDKKQVWGGAWCDTDKHKETGNEFSIMKSETDAGTIYTMGGMARTTSKENRFLGFYSKSGETYSQVGGCVEDK